MADTVAENTAEDLPLTELEAAPVVSNPPQVNPAPIQRGWAGPVLGGIIAAAAGFALAQFVPNGWPLQDTSALQTALADQQKQTTALQFALDKLASQPAAAPPDQTLLDRLTALESAKPADIASLEQKLNDLQSRLAALESLPVGAAASPEILATQKAAADKVLAAAQATAAQITADAETASKAAVAQTALGQLQAALESGAPYAAALPALANLPAILTDNAESGLPTLASLQASFPAAARAALESALRANMGESWSDRVTNFLRTQTGARSLTAREGTDPDAVLSRAEAALTKGDLTTALTEITALPSESQVALADWQAQASKRQAAVDAVAALAAAMK
jgi:hypothetical protein